MDTAEPPEPSRFRGAHGLLPMADDVSFLFVLYYYCLFSCFLTKIFHVLFCRAKRFQTVGTDRSWTSSFRMTLFALARSVTNRRADGGSTDSSLIKISYCQQTPQNDSRRLRGIPFLPCIQWTAPNSYYYCSFSCFFTKIFSMDFKLPHDILCRRAAHDNRRADGGLSDSSLIKITY